MSIVAAAPDSGAFLADDGFVLPVLPDGLFAPDDAVFIDGLDELWAAEAAVVDPSGSIVVAEVPGPPASVAQGKSRALTQAVLDWSSAALCRRRAEAAEAAASLLAEDVFRAEFEDEFGPDAWFEGGGQKCFVIDAAQVSRCGRWAAAHRLQVARRANDDLPAVWALFVRGEVGLQQVAVVAAESDDLDSDALATYDRECADVLEGQPGSRLPRLVAGVRERVQARTADERHAKARRLRNARLQPGRDGMGCLTLEGPLERLAAIDQAASTAAVAARGLAGETRSIPALKFDVLEDLMLDGFAVTASDARDALLRAHPDGPQRRQEVPQRKRVVPTVVLHVPVLTLLGRSGELPSIDGIGPISPAQAKDLCADAPSFFRVLTHPVTGARMTLDRTTYSPPADLRRWVQIRDEYCRFPGCLTPAHRCDVDHIQEWRDAGVTDDHNLVALSRDSHILKTMGLYTVTGDPDSALTFTSPTGIRHTSRPRPPAAPVPPNISDHCPF